MVQCYRFTRTEVFQTWVKFSVICELQTRNLNCLSWEWKVVESLNLVKLVVRLVTFVFFFLREKRVKYFPAECPFKLYYAKAFNESAWPNSASLYLRATSFEMLQRWRAVGNTVSDLTPKLFEPQTSS